MSTVLITGASRGIGLFLAALAFREFGLGVVAGVRSVDAARRGLGALGVEVKDGMTDVGGGGGAVGRGVRLVEVDVADEGSIGRMVREDLRGVRLDYLINNAGVSSTAKRAADLTMAELLRVFAVNAFGPMAVTRAVLENLRGGERKVVVQITSQLGSIGNNTGGSSYAYRGSKAALNQMNRSLANELGSEGFVCVAVHPGWVRTDMGGAEAPLSAEESARDVLKLMVGAGKELNGAFVNHRGERIAW